MVQTYYGPNNAVISLAGDITPERAIELVTKYFGGIAPGPPLPRTEKWIPTLDSNIRDEMEDQVPQTRIYRVYHAPGLERCGIAASDDCLQTCLPVQKARARPSPCL
jgi:zinc protease